MVKNNNKTGWAVQLEFSIGLHEKDFVLLEEIKNFFGVGSISKFYSESIRYRVFSIRDLQSIVNHFDKFGLITQKRADYELWKQAFMLVQAKKHLTVEGLGLILGVKASINHGLSEQLKTAFPNILVVNRSAVKNQIIKDPHWLAGFTAAEGCFYISISKINKIQLLFQLTQHKRDEQLKINLIEYVDCGRVSPKNQNKEAYDFRVTNFYDIETKIIPFFSKYKIEGVKFKDFSGFCSVADMLKTKAHLTKEGLELIRKIKAGMNTGRS